MAQDREETRAEIVQVAREVFSKYGYKKTTLEDIASSLCRVKSSLYYYFKNKEDIFRAVVEYEAARANTIIKDAVERESNPEDKIRAYYRTSLAFFNETVSYYKFLQEEIIDVMEFAIEVKNKHETESLRFVASLIEEGNREGTFGVDNVEAAAEAVHYALGGYENQLTSEYRMTEKKLEILLDIIFNGIKTR